MSKNKGALLSNERQNYWNVTQSSIERLISVTWMIEEFSLRTISCGYPRILSPSFRFLSSKWHLCLLPNGEDFENEGDVELFLYMENPESEAKSLYLKIKMCLEDSDGEDQYMIDFTHTFNAKECMQGDVLISREVLFREKLLDDDTLTVCCELVGRENEDRELHFVDKPTAVKREDTSTSEIPKSLEILLKDLEGLFKERKNCDVTLQVGDQTFPAHKCLLIARSKVFAAMFEHDMKESCTNIIIITDIEGTVVSDLLQYIYSGNIQEMCVEKAIGLYAAADKYALLELKAQCSDFLRKNLSEDNICNIAVLADAHNDDCVMDAVKIFAGKNTSVLTTEKWKRLARQYTTLAYEVALALALEKPTA